MSIFDFLFVVHESVSGLIHGEGAEHQIYDVHVHMSRGRCLMSHCTWFAGM